MHVQLGLGHGTQQLGQAFGGNALREAGVEEGAAGIGHGAWEIDVVIAHSIRADTLRGIPENVYAASPISPKLIWVKSGHGGCARLGPRQARHRACSLQSARSVHSCPWRRP
ncbi:hypothetical protein GmRootV35_19460 [Variovorax sp. V35]